EQREGDRRFAGPRLANESEHLAPCDRERDAVDGFHRSAGGVVVDVEVADVEDGFPLARRWGWCRLRLGLRQTDARLGHVRLLKRGLAIWSSPAEIMNKPMRMMTMTMIGGANHHQRLRRIEV